MTALALFDLDDTLVDLSGAFARWASEFGARHGLAGLAALRAAGWRVGIVTNGMRDNQLAKLIRTGLAEAVDGFCVSDAEGLRKPDPRLLHRTAERCGTRLTPDAWIIGDSPRLDVAAGHAAGIRTLWISHRRSWPSTQPAPHRAADDLTEAVRILTAAPAPKATAARPDRPASAPSRTG